MDTLTLKARAKINLTLDITGKRSDGYHLVDMLMQPLLLHDTVILRKRSSGISFKDYPEWICPLKENLMYKSALLFFRTFGIKEGIELELIKNIPSAAGLAGGSSDAAQVLKGLWKMYTPSVPFQKIIDLSVSLGADIPFCLMERPMRCSGIGEIMLPSPSLPDCHILLIKPDFPVSTRDIYKAYDLDGRSNPSSSAMFSALTNGNMKDICKHLSNDLENTAFSLHPEIKKLREIMSGYSEGTLMSGSGPTVYALFDSEEAIERASEEIPSEFSGKIQIIKTRPCSLDD